MNSIIKIIKKFGIVALSVIVIGGAYYFFIIKDGVEVVNINAGLDPIRSLEVARIVTLLDDLKSITIDESIFSNPTLVGLQDFELQIPEEAQSRDNPFAPVL